MDIQKILKEIKIKENLSQKEIAEKLDVPASYISDMIAGRKTITGKTIKKFKSVFPYCFPQEAELPFSATTERKSVFSEKNIEVLDRLLTMLEQSLIEKDKQIATLQEQVSKLIDSK
ncbi:MAG: helix-turn-helix transcriptional regulator [Bacteroidales bacterium]|nr:helix-turn-helix transcriptional regulator [Bacteroidales bacterium]MBR1775420.1 helix-turn-helix transcriptional regulator [Bacteroidales bacterium]